MAFGEAQVHRLPLALGKSCDRVGEKAGKIRIATRLACCGLGPRLDRLAARSASPLHLPDRRVTHDGKEERPHLARELEAGELRHPVPHRLVHRIRREIAIGDRAARERVHPVAMTQVERFERRRLATIGGLDQGSVVAGILVQGRTPQGRSAW